MPSIEEERTEYRKLKEFLGHGGWPCFCALVDGEVVGLMNCLIDKEGENAPYITGQAYGLRKSLRIIQDRLEELEDIFDESERKT